MIVVLVLIKRITISFTGFKNIKDERIKFK